MSRLTLDDITLQLFMSVEGAVGVLSKDTRLHSRERTMQSSLLQVGRCQLAGLLAGAMQG